MLRLMTGSPNHEPGREPSSSLPVPDGIDQDVDATVRYFLIADVRGYTRFTQTHGDEAAAALAARFAAVTREVVTADQGVLLELRGDEALVVFSSARRAIRAAVALQDRLIDQTLVDPSVPLTVGIGLDAGEAVEVEGGYRGGALNLAARLCSAAGPGQVLASAELVHLARAVTGVRYRSRGQMRFKGIAEPVTVMEVLAAVEDPVRDRRFAEVVKSGQPGVPRRRRRVLVASVAAFAVAVATAVVVLVAPGGTSVAVAADSVAVVDANDLKVVGSVPVGGRPDGIAEGFGSVWAVNEATGSVSRVDAGTRRTVQTIEVGRSPRGVAVSRNGVWVTNSGDRSVSWINPRTNTVVKTIPVGNAPTGAAAGRGSVWVTNSLDDSVSVIDATSGQVTTTIPVGRRPTAIALSDADAWVTNSGDGTVSRIDGSRRSVSDTVTVGAGPEGVAVGGGGVWVTNTLDDTVTHIDPTADRVAATIPADRGPGGIAITSAGVWVTSEYGGTLSRIDPAGDAVVRTLALGGGPRGVAVVGGSLWITADGSPTAHRGGTLRDLSRNIGDSIDPEYLSFVWLYDGLVTYRRVDGPDGGTLVPDLATALPNLTDGGKTYIFHVRKGIRYSNGVPVRAGDFRRGLERALLQKFDATISDLYAGIIGAQDCRRSPKNCQLTGVTADDAAATVTIHLSAPDGAFLNKLAFPFTAAMPPGTPLTDVGTHPVPTTGPYMVGDYVPHQHIMLVRNPRFHEWSHAAQPDGFPDRISIGQADVNVATTEVLKGNADLAEGVPNSRVGELSTRYPDQLHLDQGPFVSYLMLNTTVKPFSDRRARQAVALVVDRDEIVDLSGGKLVVAASCRMLPPTFPAYRPDCPSTHTSGPAADLAKAKQLVRASRTADAAINVVSAEARVTPYLVRLLKDLGYRNVTGITGNQYDPPAGTPLQVGFGSYGPGYPSPDAVYEPLMHCGAGFFNVAKVCDHGFDKAVVAARDLQATDPGAARVAWQKIEQTALSDAAYVPVTSGLLPALTSRRAHNFQRSAVLGQLWDEMWVEPSPTPPQGRPALHPNRKLATVTARIPLSTKPANSTVGDVWIPGPADGQVWRINSATNRVTAKIHAGKNPAQVAAGLGAVWISDTDGGTVVRIDPATNRVTKTIPVGPAPFGIGIMSGRVWVAVTGTHTVVGIDPATNKVTTKLPFGPTKADGIATLGVGVDALWVSLSLDNVVYRVDPTGRLPALALHVPTQAGLVDNDLAVGEGAVWRTDGIGGAVLRLDPGTGQIVKTIRVRPEPTSVAVVQGAVWVYSRNDGYGVISRIDPATNRIAATVAVRGDGLVPSSSGIWSLDIGSGFYRIAP